MKLPFLQDTAWSDSTYVPTAELDALESVMMADGKIYVVLAVVLIIWIGILIYLFRTDARLKRLEENIDSADSSTTE